MKMESMDSDPYQEPWKKKLRKNWHILVTHLELDTSTLMDYLFQNEVINARQLEGQMIKPPLDRNRWLLMHLLHRTQEDFMVFCEGLKVTGQEHLCGCLFGGANLMSISTTDHNSGFSAMQASCEKQQERDVPGCSSEVRTALKNHIRHFLMDQMLVVPANNEYCKTKWTYVIGDLDSLLWEYNEKFDQDIKCSVDEELFEDVMESVNIKEWDDSLERRYWYGGCRICGLLENNATGKSSEQQLKQHQEDADRVNRYCDRVMTTQWEEGVLYVYLDVYTTTGYFHSLHYLPLCCVTLIDLKSKVASCFMWEFVRAGFGDQHLLSCLKRYLERRLAEPPVRRIVLITQPYGGLLRNTDLIGLFLWVMARYGVTDVQVVYEYYGHKNQSVSDLGVYQSIINIIMKHTTADPIIPFQELLTYQDNNHLITCMTSNDMLNFINTNVQVSATNWETIQVSLNTTRWLHVTRHGSMCDVMMSRHFSDAADDAGMNYVTDFRVPLPSAGTELTPLYPSGYRLPAEWYRWVMEDGSSNVKEYMRTHVQVDESDTRKVLSDPDIIIQETDGLEDPDN